MIAWFMRSNWKPASRMYAAVCKPVSVLIDAISIVALCSKDSLSTALMPDPPGLSQFQLTEVLKPKSQSDSYSNPFRAGTRLCIR
jgi:hypothetical protein